MFEFDTDKQYKPFIPSSVKNNNMNKNEKVEVPISQMNEILTLLQTIQVKTSTFHEFQEHSMELYQKQLESMKNVTRSFQKLKTIIISNKKLENTDDVEKNEEMQVDSSSLIVSKKDDFNSKIIKSFNNPEELVCMLLQIDSVSFHSLQQTTIELLLPILNQLLLDKLNHSKSIAISILIESYTKFPTIFHLPQNKIQTKKIAQSLMHLERSGTIEELERSNVLPCTMDELDKFRKVLL
ncbi:hypothetical protein DLAC_01548 [Tieghemostelium lacteum]|uniref:Uncharacterized protein n=1 Tax=Tieghemostelium lacteum TaxID=361077 RepID=A0A152A620_TIELA|nr:hypothetical protein DLAC_01548 [Tieghemostelium lacteum]|eukprot:KYR01555.1 hypothetical protein DLAC_01548 [Tieghemostelium lacteum]